MNFLKDLTKSMVSDNIKVPRGQIIQELLCDEDDNLLQVVTSDEFRRKFNLYNVAKDGALVKIETGDNPMFDKKVF